ncbi:glutaredoxin family protein [Ramlibacter sp. AW1]|uniref:Glutaredoxin family protein n=1 Tax=Ramlibacter aurantiacus TaxID=2801330 RepID=A0A937D4S0_9BURK|nr:glutaredoxin family protein [Ramlibacter aurantiacus]MBL0422015.1 glutaredoxin family protein [Ramlibacter aurantiacus]
MSAHGIALAFVAATAAWAGPAQSQQVWRSVTPDGRVIFSDVPPPQAASPAPTAPTGAGSSASALPYALRQVADRYPVTLYTSDNCAPCATGRNLLRSRGIPFSERTISTEADVQALQRLMGERSLPVLTIGRQQIKGLIESEWQQYLDAAGYPRTSALPPNWRPAAPMPLVASAPAPAAAPQPAPAAAADPPPARAPSAPARTGDNPAGIQF